MKRRRLSTFLMTTLTVLFASASLGLGQEDLEPQGTFIWGRQGVTPGIAPLGNLHLNARWVAMSIMDPLVFFSASEGDFSPGLATSWDFSDPTVLGFELRQGVTFHDGAPFTSADIVASVNLAKSLPGTLAATYQLIDRAEATGDYSVNIHLRAPSSELLFALPLLWIVPDWAEADYETYSQNPVGTGPFRLVSFSPEDRVVMEANEEYWMEGAPRLARLEYVAIPEDSSRATAVLTGDVHVAELFPGSDFGAAEANPNVSLVPSTATSYRVLWMNAGREPFSNPLARQAIRHAIDIDAVEELVWPELGLPARSIIPRGTNCYSEQQPAEYNLDRARELLAEAGYPDGFSLEILKRPNPKTTEEGDVVVAMLQSVGIDASYVVLQSSVFIDTALRQEQNYDMLVMQHRNVLSDPAFIIRRLYSDQARDLTGWGKTSEPEQDAFEAALVRAVSATDPDEICAAWAEAQQLMWNAGTVMNLSDVLEYYAVRDNVGDFVPDSIPDFRFVSIRQE